LALVLRPKLVIADEPTTALDVLVEAQLLSILADLKRNFDTPLRLITHNLGIVAEACDRVAVMYAGRIAEEGDARTVFSQPAHPYTRELLRSVISLNTTGLHYIPGAPPSLIARRPPASSIPAVPTRCGSARSWRRWNSGCRPASAWSAGCTGPATGSPRVGGNRSSRGGSRWRRRRRRGRRKRAARGRGPAGALPAARVVRCAPGRQGRRRRPGGGRRLVLGGARRGAWDRRRGGQRQDHARPRSAAPRRSDRRLDQARGRGCVGAARTRGARDAAQGADGVPGPARLAEPGDDDRDGGRPSVAHPRHHPRPRGHPPSRLRVARAGRAVA